MLIVDSREKWTQIRPGQKPDTHISAYLERHGIPWEVRKLDVGDYMLEGGSVTVDRKQNLAEIAHNLTNANDKLRFWREVRLAYDMGHRLVVLIEDNKRKTLDDIHGWRSPYTKVTGAAILRQMDRLRYCYGVRFVFCPKRSAAKRILEILQGDST